MAAFAKSWAARMKESPGRAGALGSNEETSRGRTLDAPILSQGVRAAIKKGLRHAVIAFSYRHYVAAYPTGRVHCAVPSDKNHNTALRRPMAARNKARWVPHHCPQERRAGEALQPSGE
jgi:hypothetical protein